MAQSNNWCSEQDEILIHFVRNHEALFNIKSAEYRKIQLKQKLWQEVGTILNKTDNNCSKRWAYIRDYFIRKLGNPGTGSADEAAKKRSELLSFLDSCPSGKRSTVSNIPHSEDASQNVDENTQIDSQNISQTIEPNLPRDEDADSLSLDVYPPESFTKIAKTSTIACSTPEMTPLRLAKKRKSSSTSEARLQLLQDIARRSQHVPEPQDETDLFFASLALIVKKLPPQEQVTLRLEVGTLIGNAELAFYNQANSNIYYFPSPGTSTSTDENTEYNFTQTG